MTSTKYLEEYAMKENLRKPYLSGLELVRVSQHSSGSVLALDLTEMKKQKPGEPRSFRSETAEERACLVASL